MIKEGKVTQDGKIVPADGETESGENYRIHMDLPLLRFDVKDYLVKQTADVIFFYKPPFMHTERNTPLDELCLGDVVSAEFPEFRLISRLDYGVDGVVAAVRKGLRVSGERKVYLAWLKGIFPEHSRGRWEIDADKRRRVKAFESPSGGEMRFRCLKQAGGYSLTEIELASAKRHQVRAVCAALDFPIWGDRLYGAGEGLSGRIALHCVKVCVNGAAAESPHRERFENDFLWERS